MNKRGNLTLYVFFIVLSIVVVTVAAVLAPMGVLFTSEMFAAGEDIFLDANETISQISDDEVRTAMLGSVDSAYENADTNVEVLSSFYRWGWVFVLVLAALAAVIFTRQSVEYGRGFV